MYKITVKRSLTVVLEGQITFKPTTQDSHLDVTPDQLDQLIFDLESSFNNWPNMRSNMFRVHIEKDVSIDR